MTERKAMKRYNDNGFFGFWGGLALFLIGVIAHKDVLVVVSGLIIVASSVYIFWDYLSRLLKRLRR